MNLRYKTIIIVSLLIAALLISVLLYTKVRNDQIRGFEELDKLNASRNMDRVLNVFNNSSSDMEVLVTDWGQWDDTYRFMVDHNEDYLESNITEATFLNANLEHFIYLSPQGEIIHSRSFDQAEEEFVPTPDDLLSSIVSESPMMGVLESGELFTGLLKLSDQTVFLYSYPVLTSDGEGPARGVLVMGRRLTDAIIDSVSEILQIDCSVILIDETAKDPKMAENISQLKDTGAPVVEVVDQASLKGYALVNDIYGNPILVIRAKMPREVFLAGKSGYANLLFYILVATFLLGAMVRLVMEHDFISRISKVTGKITKVAQSGSLNMRVPVEGGDELTDLANLMNEMLARIQNDVEEKARVEEEKKQLEAQVRHVQKLESLGVLAGGIAHDFNNLLMGVLGNAELASMKLPEESSVMINLHHIRDAAQKASNLTNQMLAYSGKGKFVVTPINLSTTIQEMGHLLEVGIKNRVEMNYNLSTEIPCMEGDISQINQIVMNLITNAADAIEDDAGIVSVTTGVMECDEAYLQTTYLYNDIPTGKYLYLEVEDTGSGMDEETMDRIFEPFFSTKEMGRGLGLSAVQGIVRGHHGALKITTVPGEGTTFRVLFPVSDKKTGEVAAEKPEETGDYMGSGTILVVDDEETVRGVAKMTLEEFGFKVVTAVDGLDGVAKYQEHQDVIDLVLLDMTMPRMDGASAFKEMRTVRDDIYVLLSSGYNEHEAAAQLLEEGHTGFLKKPYSPLTLVELVRDMIGK